MKWSYQLAVQEEPPFFPLSLPHDEGADIVERDVQTTISVTDRVNAHDYDKVVLRGTSPQRDARDDIRKHPMGVQAAMQVLLFGTCLVDTFFPEAGEATVRLLRRFGAEPVFPKGQTCCGQPAFNAGYEAAARTAAEHFLWEFDGNIPIVTPSGSCAAMVKHHYPWLFRDDPKRLAKAKRAGERIFELTQYLVHVAKAHEAGLRGKGTITYHSSCHLTRSLGVREEPLTLLSSLKGGTFVPMPDAARCCGFGGTFMAKLPEISCALADEKAASIEATGADTVTGCDSGCLMNIADAMRRRGTKIRVAHIAQLLAEGL